MNNSVFGSKEFLFASILCIVPIIAGAMLYAVLPDQMPIHFNGNFEPDSFTQKWVAVFVVPTGMCLLNAFVWWVMEAEPKKNSINRHIKSVLRWLIPVITIIVQGAVISYSIGVDIKISRFMPLAIGILLIITGNYLPKCRQNYTAGIRLPWTLASEENWNRTHRLGGKTMVIAGIIIVVCSFVKVNFAFLIIPIIAAVIIPAVYSYMLYRKNI